jgi:uncharacterized protein (DUF433 family)
MGTSVAFLSTPRDDFVAGPADIAEQIDKLDPVEREQLLTQLLPLPEFHFLRWSSAFKAFRPTRYPGIVRTPGVCGGSARFIRSRIPVWAVVRMQQIGASDLDILRSFPSLRAVDLAEAWAFAEDHHEEVEKDIRENEDEGEPPSRNLQLD